MSRNSGNVNLDKLIEEFTLLEQKITDVYGKNNLLEILLQDANRFSKFYWTKEKILVEERDSLLLTVNRLLQTLQEQCNLRVENERLKNNMAGLKQQNERTAENGEAKIQQLISEMKAEEERHKRELETVRQQCRRQVEEAHMEGFSQLVAKDAEVKKLLEQKDLALEEMKKKFKDQESEKQSEHLKLQVEFGMKLARMQNTAQCGQQQHKQHDSHLIAQSFFKSKLQAVREENNKTHVALRQRIKELEENQRAGGLTGGLPKNRKF